MSGKIWGWIQKHSARRGLLFVCGLAVCGTLFGMSYASYLRKSETAASVSLEDYQVEVADAYAPAQPAKWDVDLPATTRLYEDDQFRLAAVSVGWKLTNKSDFDLNLKASYKESTHSGFALNGKEDSGNAEDICVFLTPVRPGEDLAGAILQSESFKNMSADSSVREIRSALTEHNKETLKKWITDDGRMKPGGEKFLYAIIWRENAADKNGGNGTISFEETFHMKGHLLLNIEQILDENKSGS